MLRTTYVPFFLEALFAALEDTHADSARAIEFGCGAGLATHCLAEELASRGVPVELMIGADFVPGMIEAARQDLADYGSEWARKRVRYVVAAHEALSTEVPTALGKPPEDLAGSFQLAIGVSTFRYAVRQGTARRTVEEIDRLLSPGGRVVVIDMNERFPYGLKPQRRRGPANGALRIRFGVSEIPSLDEYARPFADAGFEVHGQYVGWVPHSANGFQFWLARAASPVLSHLAHRRAMRSVVIARKPV